MNNCYEMNMNYSKIHSTNSPKINYENGYIFYECFVDDNKKFQFYETTFDSLLHRPLSVTIQVSKRIPRIFHKAILYYYYIPNY